MIDTLILRIHDTAKYSNLIKNLDAWDSKGYTTETGRFERGIVSDLRAKGFRKGSEIVDMLKMNRTGEYLVKSKHAKHVNASNHYSFTTFINYTKNYIEFNFSVPKYVYGSNVLMFVDHFGDRHYSYHECSNLSFNVERCFDRLMSFISQLFRLEFPFDTIYPNDVEINRVDVCFNQLFTSKENALRYLEYQKRLKKKYARDEDGVVREYTTSLMYVTKRYSAKIYHKGSEYAKNDSKEHYKINKEKGRQYFNIKEYQFFSDKMLRYELTIRNLMLNYLHKRNLFRKNCNQFQALYKIYSEVENAMQSNKRITQKAGALDEKEKAEFLSANPYVKITREGRSIHKYIGKLITKKTYFTLEIDEASKIYNKVTYDFDCSHAKFSKPLLRLCLEKLFEFIEEFQLKELPAEDNVIRSIEIYNKEYSKKLPSDDMLWFYKKLIEIGSFKETAKFYNLSRATLYRYKDRFKKIGITENNILPVTDDGIPEAPIDLRSYHSIVSYTAGFLKSNNILNLF